MPSLPFNSHSLLQVQNSIIPTSTFQFQCPGFPVVAFLFLLSNCFPVTWRSDLYQFLEDDLLHFISKWYEYPFLVIKNAAKNFDVTKVPNRLHVFDEEGMADWIRSYN